MRRIVWILIATLVLAVLAFSLLLVRRSEFRGWTFDPGWTIVESAEHQSLHVAINGPALAYLTSPIYTLNGSTVDASISARIASIQGHSGLLFYIEWVPSNASSIGSLFILPSDWQITTRTESVPVGATAYRLRIRAYAHDAGDLLDAWVDAPATNSY